MARRKHPLESHTKLEVVLNATSLYRAPNGRVGGRMYLRLGDRTFPDETWFDFPIPVLGWWLASAREVSSCSRAECSFMFLMVRFGF